MFSLPNYCRLEVVMKKISLLMLFIMLFFQSGLAYVAAQEGQKIVLAIWGIGPDKPFHLIFEAEEDLSEQTLEQVREEFGKVVSSWQRNGATPLLGGTDTIIDRTQKKFPGAKIHVIMVTDGLDTERARKYFSSQSMLQIFAENNNRPGLDQITAELLRIIEEHKVEMHAIFTHSKKLSPKKINEGQAFLKKMAENTYPFGEAALNSVLHSIKNDPAKVIVVNILVDLSLSLADMTQEIVSLARNVAVELSAISAMDTNGPLPPAVADDLPAEAPAVALLPEQPAEDEDQPVEIVTPILQKILDNGGSEKNLDPENPRTSLEWNKNQTNLSDLDLHVRTPNDGHVYYRNKKNDYAQLDVDIINPIGTAVENIVLDKKNMVPGQYEFFVRVFFKREGKGFETELYINGNHYNFEYQDELVQGEDIHLLSFDYDDEGTITVLKIHQDVLEELTSSGEE